MMMRRVGVVGVVGEYPSRGLEPVHLGHADVHQHHVGACSTHRIEGLGAGCCLGHDIDRAGSEDHPET